MGLSQHQVVLSSSWVHWPQDSVMMDFKLLCYINGYLSTTPFVIIRFQPHDITWHNALIKFCTSTKGGIGGAMLQNNQCHFFSCNMDKCSFQPVWTPFLVLWAAFNNDKHSLYKSRAYWLVWFELWIRTEWLKIPMHNVLFKLFMGGAVPPYTSIVVVETQIYINSVIVTIFLGIKDNIIRSHETADKSL